jgi:hypothetical protein
MAEKHFTKMDRNLKSVAEIYQGLETLFQHSTEMSSDFFHWAHIVRHRLQPVVDDYRRAVKDHPQHALFEHMVRVKPSKGELFTDVFARATEKYPEYDAHLQDLGKTVLTIEVPVIPFSEVSQDIRTPEALFILIDNGLIKL